MVSGAQYDQDGIFNAIFSLIGVKDGSFLEIGGGGDQDNCFHMRVDNGFKGFGINSAGYYMGGRSMGIQVLNYFVFPTNVNQIFETHNISKELDILSIDIDSMDYHVWEALDSKYRPRVIVVEFNPNFPISVKAKQNHGHGWDGYSKEYGSSFGAFIELAKRKGYTYVYHMAFTDIFFIRDDIVPEELKGIDPNETYDAHPLHQPFWSFGSYENRYEFIYW